MDIIQLFCEIDDFFLTLKQQVCQPLLNTKTSNKRNRSFKTPYK